MTKKQHGFYTQIKSLEDRLTKIRSELAEQVEDINMRYNGGLMTVEEYISKIVELALEQNGLE